MRGFFSGAKLVCDLYEGFAWAVFAVLFFYCPSQKPVACIILLHLGLGPFTQNLLVCLAILHAIVSPALAILAIAVVKNQCVLVFRP